MGKKKPADKALQRTLDYLAWLERWHGDSESASQLAAVAEELRENLATGDVYEIVQSAVKLGALDHAAHRTKQWRAWQTTLKARANAGRPPAIDPAHHAELLERAAKMRDDDPKRPWTEIDRDQADYYRLTYNVTVKPRAMKKLRLDHNSISVQAE